MMRDTDTVRIRTHLEFENVDHEEDTLSRVLLGALREHGGYLLASTAGWGHEVDHHLIIIDRDERPGVVGDIQTAGQLLTQISKLKCSIMLEAV